MSGFAFVLFAYWAILNLSLANSLMCQDYKYCLHIEGKWQRKTSKLGKHKTPQGTPPPPNYGAAPFSLIWPWVQVSPGTWHVIGGAEQEGPLCLLVQQGLQVPA